MANVLPEVRPLVESMPHEGFVMQTGGSARRSFIKNNGFDHYFVHGVPGHTHNSSAMLSVTADYSERRGVAEDISAGVWAEEKVDLGVNDFTDSVEPDDAAQLYDRAIERGIGTITLIPENCQHIIKEPARSISEVRTIVSGKDRLDTLTYVNNEYGWVDPVSGNLGSAFNRTVPVQVNFFGYPAPLGDVHGISVPNVQVVNAPTIRQPVYIGSRNNDKWRYAITSKGASAPGVVPDWDGNVPFLWDDDTHTYRSKKFSKWFGAALVQTEAVGVTEEIGTGPRVATTYNTLSIAAGFAQIGTTQIGANTIHVHGTGAFKLDKLQVPVAHAALVPILQAQFKVTFPAYSTSVAQDGYCVLSRAPNEMVYSNDLKKLGVVEGLGFSLVPDLPVEVHIVNNKITDQPYWFGPPAYRIAVGGTLALPGPIRDIGETGSGVPGNYDDKQLDFFAQITARSLVMRKRTFQYGDQFMKLLRPVDIVPGAADGTLATTYRTFDLSPGVALGLHLTTTELTVFNNNVFGANQQPTNHNSAEIHAAFWSNCVSNFNAAPYMFVQYLARRAQGPGVTAQEYFRRAKMDERLVGMSGMDEQFKFAESPYLRNMYYPSNRPTGYTPQYTCDGRVNRPSLTMQPYENTDGVANHISMVNHTYNQLTACPLNRYIFTCLLAGQYSVNDAPTDMVNPGGGQYTNHLDIYPINWNHPFGNVAEMNNDEQEVFLGDPYQDHVHHDGSHDDILVLRVPQANHLEMFRGTDPAIGANEPQFDDDAHNVALHMYRRHFKEWIERSLYTFHDDDAFTPAFSYAAGVAGRFESPAYAALGKTPHTHGGYRLYSARATLSYSAPYIVTNEAAAAANAFNPLAGPNVHPLIDSESFTYLMDHTHMTPDVDRRLELTFTGNSTPLVVHDGDTERNPAEVVGIAQAGYAVASPYTEVLIDIDGIDQPVVNGAQGLSAYAEDQVTIQNDVGFTTVDGVPNIPVVLTSRTQGMPRDSQEELGNYFVVPLGPTVAKSRLARSDPNAVGNPDHLDFRHFYWNFADNRPMFLLFNNYGWSREASRQEGLWGNQPLPVPIAFSFNSQDAHMVLLEIAGPRHVVTMRIPYNKLERVNAAGVVSYFVDAGPLNLPAKINCAWHGGTGKLVQAADVLEAAAIQAGNEFEQRQLSPHMCLFVPGSRTAAEFMSDNYSAVRAQSNSRGLVHRVKNRISQHLCAPILNPDMRLGCIAPLNHDTRHLPPEMRDFVLRMTDVNFDFLQTTEPVTMNEIVLSEFNGGVQDIATSESLLYLPNFMEYQTQVSADLTFSKDCYSGTGVPAFLCIFCRSGSVIGFQPLITTLSLQNRTTMKKSDTVFETDIHELFHMTQRNVHNRSEYEHTAFNKRQTILLASEDVGIMGMDPADNYQQQKRVVIRVSGTCTHTGTVTVLFIYNNRGLYLTGVQQSVVRL